MIGNFHFIELKIGFFSGGKLQLESRLKKQCWNTVQSLGELGQEA